MSQRRDAEGKRAHILAALLDGIQRSTGEIAYMLDTTGPGALYLLRGLEAKGLVRCIREGREWCWHRPYKPVERTPEPLSASDVEGMP